MAKEVRAKLSNLRIAPRKVRLVGDLIRGKSVVMAKAQLAFVNKKAAPILLKLLNSAVANAKNNFNLNEENLYLKKVLIDGGASLKRWRPVWKGMAHPIMKRTSHITLILGEHQDKKSKDQISNQVKA